MKWSRAIVIATSSAVSTPISAREELSIFVLYLFSLDLAVFMLSSIPYGIFNSDPHFNESLTATSTIVFLGLELLFK
ncbi:MAG: hypothetical protein QXW58_05010 [Thermosphaera sp.]